MPLLPPAIAATDFITGERLQALCDLSIISEPILSFHTSLSETVTKVTLPELFTETTGGFPMSLELPILLNRFLARSTLRRIIKRIKSAQSIFLYTHLLPGFIEYVLPRLEHPFVLMTHNSDNLVTDRFRPLLDNPILKRWFASSAVISHPQLECLPIGLANAQWPHGDIAKMATEMAKQQPKTYRVYVNFSPNTHPSRAPLLELLKARGFVVAPSNLPYDRYLSELAEHRYCISPLGNGFDAHRTWESLLLGVVPIVTSEIAAAFPELPMLAVSNWKQVTPQFLDEAYQRFENAAFDYSRLRLSWWKKRIHETIRSRDKDFSGFR